MPFTIEERDGKFCVVSPESDKPKGCHDSKEEAREQQKALYANTDYSARFARLERTVARLTRLERLEAAVASVARLEFESMRCPPGSPGGGRFTDENETNCDLDDAQYAQVKVAERAAEAAPGRAQGGDRPAEEPRGGQPTGDFVRGTKVDLTVPGLGGRVGGNGAIDLRGLDQIPRGKLGRELPTPEKRRDADQIGADGKTLTREEIEQGKGFGTPDELRAVRWKVLDLYPGSSNSPERQQQLIENGIRAIQRHNPDYDTSGIVDKATLSTAIREQRIPNGVAADGSVKFREGNPNRDFGQDQRGKTADGRGGDSGDRKADSAEILRRFGDGMTVIDPYTGTRLSYEQVTIDRMQTNNTGGNYTAENVFPASAKANDARGDQPIEDVFRDWASRDPELRRHPNWPKGL